MRKPLLLVLALLAAYYAAFRLPAKLDRWADERAQGGAQPLGPQPGPPPAEVAAAVRLEKVWGGLDQPLFLTFAPGDPAKRIFVVEKTGRVRIAKGGALLERPFLDISGAVSRGGEQGLLSIAFHPKHAENGLLYANYTDKRGDTRVVEYRVAKDDPDRADPASAKEILHVKQPFANHNGGGLAFAPDGRLWIGMGDGGLANDPLGAGQDDATDLAKMLRVDVGAARDERGRPPVERRIKGVRNPWRFSFDRETGDLYIGDVGQNRWEEVHVVPKGGAGGENLGWNHFEGFHPFARGVRGLIGKGGDAGAPPHSAPAVEYGHDAGVSITGGYVYRGKEVPALAGCYFFADYQSALVRSFRWKEGRVSDYWEWRPALDPKRSLALIASFGEDEAGELYILSLEGSVYRLCAAGAVR
jgi:glucose/arabinose dehydrogenase